jgi:hypothetical protein
MTPRILEAILGRAKELGVDISDVEPWTSAVPTRFGRVPFVIATTVLTQPKFVYHLSGNYEGHSDIYFR